MMEKMVTRVDDEDATLIPRQAAARLAASRLAVPGVLLLVGLDPAAVAAASMANEALQVTAGVTAVALRSDDRRVSDEGTLSMDLVLSRRTQGGQWRVYLEAFTALDPDRVSATLPEVNGDGGALVSGSSDGRIQVSELSYQLPVTGDGVLTLGLIDPSSYLDQSLVTVDENTQFLAGSLTNNPTIAFPDYTLGLHYSRKANRGPDLALLVAATQGISDRNGLAYDKSLNLHEGAEGLFSALELSWQSASVHTRVGAWIDSGEHEDLSTGLDVSDNSGLYAVVDFERRSHGFSLRAGMADKDLSFGSQFVSLGWRHDNGTQKFGLALAWSGLSSEISTPGFDDSWLSEAYLRLRFGRFEISPVVQYVVNSGFVSTGADYDSRTWVGALRFHYNMQTQWR